MDPVARRFMWEVIERIARKASVILVSHSMEECEALCNRVGILVGGRLRCVGSVQHLKNKFGQGFHCEIKLRSPKPERVAELLAQANLTATDRVNHGNLLAVCEKLGSKDRADLVRADGPGWLIYGSLFAGVPAKEFVEWFVEESMSAIIAAFMAQAFTGCQLSERHGNRMWFKIPKPEMALGDMFATLEAAKEELQINECVAGAGEWGCGCGCGCGCLRLCVCVCLVCTVGSAAHVVRYWLPLRVDCADQGVCCCCAGTR